MTIFSVIWKNCEVHSYLLYILWSSDGQSVWYISLWSIGCLSVIVHHKIALLKNLIQCFQAE